jgi:hypothetical protein
MMLNALFPSVKCDDVEQISESKVPPDPAFVAQINLADAGIHTQSQPRFLLKRVLDAKLGRLTASIRDKLAWHWRPSHRNRSRSGCRTNTQQGTSCSNFANRPSSLYVREGAEYGSGLCDNMHNLPLLAVSWSSQTACYRRIGSTGFRLGEAIRTRLTIQGKFW